MGAVLSCWWDYSLCWTVAARLPIRHRADAGSNDAVSNDELSITESCYDAAHEGKGTVSFQIDGRAVQLTATSSWVKSYLAVITPQGDDGGARESWAWIGRTQVGSRACDPAGGIIYVAQGSASQFGTCFRLGAPARSMS